MERVLFQEIVTPADPHEHHKWARRVGAFYGLLFLGGIRLLPAGDITPGLTSPVTH